MKEYDIHVHYTVEGESPGQNGHILACPRRKVAKLNGLVPGHWIRALEQNQKIASCCRHPENHELEAFYSSWNWKHNLRPDGFTYEPWGGVPDVYIFHCPCGRKHRRFMVGIGDPRPTWGWREVLRGFPLLDHFI